jgi:DNA-binding NarL/FixJ family response regulator
MWLARMTQRGSRATPQLAFIFGLTCCTWFVAELSDGFFADRLFVVSLVLVLALGGYTCLLSRGLQQERRLRQQAEELVRTSGGRAAGRLLLRQHGRAVHRLTTRETEVLTLVASGWMNQAIAEELHISLNTVERHTANVYRKLDVRGRVEATAYAVQQGLVRLD